MNNIQEIFDAYLRTKPSAEKIRSATAMMIHIGKALNVSTQEEITSDYYDELCTALDDFFVKSPQKAILDKAILAEMIGRIGPQPKINRILKSLLMDKNENVRQYALKSLEFSATNKPRSVIPFIDKHIYAKEEDLVTTAENLAANILCSPKNKSIKNKIDDWYQKNDKKIILSIMERVRYLMQNGMCEDQVFTKESLLDWIEKDFPKILPEVKSIFK